MPDPLNENEPLEKEILKEAYAILQDMRENNSFLPHKYLEEGLRPRLRLAFLDVQLKEAKRCESYKLIGSPRVIELEAARNKLAYEVAKLDGRNRKL